MYRMHRNRRLNDWLEGHFKGINDRVYIILNVYIMLGTIIAVFAVLV